jgi:hypothetical protein
MVTGECGSRVVGPQPWAGLRGMALVQGRPATGLAGGGCQAQSPFVVIEAVVIEAVVIEAIQAG